MAIMKKYIDRYPTVSMTNNPPRDRYPSYLPEVLSCKKQIIAIRMVHTVSNETTHVNTALLSLVATAHL